MTCCPQCGADASNSEICPRCGARIDSACAASPSDVGTQTADSISSAAVAVPTIPGFWGAIGVCLRKPLSWKGRASRSEFWYFFLVCYLLYWANIPLARETLRLSPPASVTDALFSLYSVGSLSGLTLAIVVASVTIRRFHDSGRSAWNYLWILVPRIALCVALCYEFSNFSHHAPTSTLRHYGMTAYSGLIVVSFLYVLILCAWPPTHGTNKYGPEPRKRA